MAHRFNPEHANKLDNKKRREALPPEQIIKGLNLSSIDKVLDLGAGTGYFSIPMAKIVNKVFAVDISPKMLGVLKDNIAEEGLENIELIEHSIESLPFEDQSIDKVIASLVMHEVSDLPDTLKEIVRVLKEEGKVLFIEWEKKESESGPPIHERLLSTDFKEVLMDYFTEVNLERPNEDQYIITGIKQN